MTGLRTHSLDQGLGLLWCPLASTAHRSLKHQHSNCWRNAGGLHPCGKGRMWSPTACCTGSSTWAGPRRSAPSTQSSRTSWCPGKAASWSFWSWVLGLTDLPRQWAAWPITSLKIMEGGRQTTVSPLQIETKAQKGLWHRQDHTESNPNSSHLLGNCYISRNFPPIPTITLPGGRSRDPNLCSSKKLGKWPNIKIQNPKASNPEISDSKTPWCFHQTILLLYKLKNIPASD